MLVDEVFDAVEVLELPPGGGGAAHGVVEDGVGEVGGHAGVGVVEVGEGGVLAVVGDVGVGALGVGEVRGGEPVEGVGEVFGDAEAEAALAGGGGPDADDIFAGAGGDGVPAGLVPGVPEVVAVVVDAHGEEVFGAGVLVEIHEVLGVPLVGGEEVDEVFVADFGLRAEALAVVLVLVGAFHVHVAGVPVAVADGGLRAPVGPDAELGVGEPVGRGVGAEGGAGVGVGAGGDGEGRGGGGLAVVEWVGRRLLRRAKAGAAGGEELEGLAAGELHAGGVLPVRAEMEMQVPENYIASASNYEITGEN